MNIGVKLEWDRPDKKTIAARRRAAGCAPNPNRCSTKKGYKAGYNCDEYPFASTISNGKVRKRVNRCVLKSRTPMSLTPSSALPVDGGRCTNGAIKNKVARSASSIPARTARASLTSPATSRLDSTRQAESSIATVCPYLRPPFRCTVLTCLSLTPAKRGKGKGKASKCKNDGNEEIGPGGAKGRSVIQGRAADNSTMKAPAHAPRYKTSSGSEIVVPGGAQIGQTVVRVKAVDPQLWNAHAESREFEEKIVDGYDT